MPINLVISFLFFLFTFFNWYSHLDSQNLGIKSAGSKFSNALSNGPFLYEVFIFFIGVLLSIIFMGLVAYIVSNNLKKVGKGKISSLFCLILTWLFLSITIFSLSSYFYPDLFFSHPSLANKTLIIIMLLFFSILVLSSFFISKNIKITSFVILILLVPEITFINVNNDIQTTSKPNVFIIGIDSLNQEEINEKQTPFLQNFINESIYLPNTYTHVARTFPSWVSILTGDYPLTNKARLNLTNFNQIDLTKALPYYLKNAGYTNYYIQDERRFNNIDERFFFDKVIGPPASAAEFILSKFVDLPLLALTSKLNFFNYFMPHIHDNRAVWSTYSPEKFNLKLERGIHNPGVPVFIASHFTLPHWPYKIKRNDSSRSSYDKYLHSVQLVDKQVELFMAHLKSEGLLDNSLIFLITDHGESFGRKIDVPKNSSNFTNTAGHGTTIISSSQFKVLFSFKEYEGGTLVNHTAPNKELNYALTDIAPTIIDLLDIDNKRDSDGTSIFKVQQQRPIPLESSLKPMFNKQGEIDEEKTVKQTANLFEVDSLGKVVFNNQLYHEVVKSKQRGVIKGKWQLSVFPEHNNNIYITNLQKDILYNQQALNNEELIAELRKSFCHLFSSEIDEAEINLCKSATQKTDSFGR